MGIGHLLPKGIKKRILMLFFVFTLMFSALLTGGGLILLHQGEKQLQSIDMGLAIERIRKQYLEGEDVGRVNRFFYGEKNALTFPSWVRNLPAGFHKVQRDHLTWHVMISDFPDQRYILLRDYTVFESSRLHPIWLSLIILMSSLVLSSILVWITLFYVIYPIEKLEKNIRENLSPQNKNQLAESYGDHEIGQLARSFDEVYDKLNQALQRERLFTADVSHELRTPLMVILSSCELLLAKPVLTAKAEQRLYNIQHAAQQILQRLQVYFALARQTSSTLEHFKQLTIAEIASAVIAENQSLAQRYQIALQLNTHDVTTQYPADFCHSVLSNLIRNAIEYAGPNSTITVSIQKNGFTVSDNGVGIKSEFQPYIFDAFTRSDWHSDHHLGLGLSLVQRICQYMQWEIEFSSQPNQGAAFRIYTDSESK